MISNQLLQKTLDELKEITKRDMAIIDTDGRVSVETSRNLPIDLRKASAFLNSTKDSAQIPDFQLFRIREDDKDVYILAIQGDSPETKVFGGLVRYQIETRLAEYRERFDKDNFIKSLLLDNLLLVDIFDRSRRLHIEIEANRAVFLIRLKDKNQDDAINSLKNMFSEHGDFVTALDRKRIIVVRELEDENAEEIAAGIFNVIKSDVGDEATIAYGSVAETLKDVSRSFKEAKMAMEVGDTFFPDRRINSYEKLGIGRLIYQLPLPLCKLFIGEIFKNISPMDMDAETIETINKFFENSLNVSETSRQLFIHRNTLVYRLDKIQKLTGLDLRVFDDAITFKIALMVSNYMQYTEGQDS